MMSSRPSPNQELRRLPAVPVIKENKMTTKQGNKFLPRSPATGPRSRQIMKEHSFDISELSFFPTGDNEGTTRNLRHTSASKVSFFPNSSAPAELNLYQLGDIVDGTRNYKKKTPDKVELRWSMDTCCESDTPLLKPKRRPFKNSPCNPSA